MPTPRVYVCGERGCGRKRERRALVAALDGTVEVVEVRCQSVCDGPVAGTVVGGTLQWFRRLRTPKRRAGLVRVAADGRRRLPKPLAKRRVPKRAGKLRG